MGSLDKRIEALERLYQTSGDPEVKEEQDRELLEQVRRAKERATAEALETGDSRRLYALEDLERHMLERIERRRPDES